MPYVITFEDKRWNTDDLTINEGIEIEEATGESWVFINPFRSAKHWKAIVLAFLKRDTDETEAENRIEAFCRGQGSITKALDLVKTVEDGESLPSMFQDGQPDPKAEGATETT